MIPSAGEEPHPVAVVLGEVAGRFYLLDVVRARLAAPDFLDRLVALQETYQGAPVHAYIAGQEGGVIDTMRKLQPSLNVVTSPAVQDKFTRAQPCAAAWCAGRILLPKAASWLDTFVSEVVSFTGVGDVHDDQIDATVAAFDAASGAAVAAARRQRNDDRWQNLTAQLVATEMIYPRFRSIPVPRLVMR